MEKKIKTEMLTSIGIVLEGAKDSMLADSFFKNHSKELSVVSEYFNTTPFQSFFISNVFAFSFKGYNVELDDIIRHTNCNPMRILEFSDELEQLNETNIIKRIKSRNSLTDTFYNCRYIINSKIMEAILNSQPLPELGGSKFNSLIDMLEELSLLYMERGEDEIDYFDFIKQSESIIKNGSDLNFVKKIKKMGLSSKESIAYFLLIWKTLNGTEQTEVQDLLKTVFLKPSQQVTYLQKILAKESILVTQMLVEVHEGPFFNDAALRLSDFSRTLLREEGIQVYFRCAKKSNMIEPQSIGEKKLFFNAEESRQLDMIRSLLVDKKLKVVQQRLLSSNLPKGVTILLYGPSGTGKTESVYQIAKETGRVILRVDISQSKSMWFGESEKLIKRIFTDYKILQKEYELEPILLFNEADALIAKRKEISGTSVSQTENAIQNIILEELERFNGIFFATTNLVSNIDSAFERRFLFKVELQTPNISTKALIWKSKMRSLNRKECERLAKDFNFSGGQIDNIVRKCSMFEVINGQTVSFSKIVEFCQAEGMNRVVQKHVGFRLG